MMEEWLNNGAPASTAYQSLIKHPDFGVPYTPKSALTAFTDVTSNSGSNAFLTEEGTSVFNLNTIDNLFFNKYYSWRLRTIPIQ